MNPNCSSARVMSTQRTCNCNMLKLQMSKRAPLRRPAIPNRTRMEAGAATSQDVDADRLEQETKVRSEVTRRIKNLGRSGKAKEAVSELVGMARMGIQPDRLAATALIDACMRSGKIDMAESVFEELFSELLEPDEITFTVLLRGYGEQTPPRWTAISNTLSTMESTYGLVPGVATFNVLLEICSRTNDETRGFEIVERMKIAGVEADEYTIEAVKQRKSLRTLIKKTFF